MSHLQSTAGQIQQALLNCKDEGTRFYYTSNITISLLVVEFLRWSIDIKYSQKSW